MGDLEEKKPHKRSDLEKTPEEEEANGGDAKRPRDGEGDYSGAMEMDEDEDEDSGPSRPFDPDATYRKQWCSMYVKRAAKFDEPTRYGPMRHTDGPVLPISAQPMDTMEVFYVNVSQVAGLQWPLEVYGDVAVRDSLDNMRNYIFRRGRDDCQILTSPQDSLLDLTGPTRAVMLLDPPIFEIDLKVKGKGSPSEDKVLCCLYFSYNNRSYKGDISYAKTRVVSSENDSAIEVRFAHFTYSLEATITAHLVRGSGNFRGRFTARTASIGEDVVLLDSRDRAVPVGKDGVIALRRRVVVVEHRGKLVLGLKATELGDTESCSSVEKKLTFPARSALRSERFFAFGSSMVQMTVAWSLLP